MIPVHQQPEPATFDAQVRTPGLAYLAEMAYALNLPLPPNATIEPYWRGACLTDLHRAYGGICAYLCVFVERCSGGMSVDHFVAKSANAGLAYEWSNYRLACSIMNSRKRDYSDVLDPFALAHSLLMLQLSTGHIYPNPKLQVVARRIVEQTIERLGLDDPICREMRARWFQEYLEYQLPSAYLKSKSPFVWYEAKRQGLLKLD